MADSMIRARVSGCWDAALGPEAVLGVAVEADGVREAFGGMTSWVSDGWWELESVAEWVY
ncbi:hypothetical protein V3N99_19725 [Dermatophilaceae bacterium Soc4.6]